MVRPLPLLATRRSFRVASRLFRYSPQGKVTTFYTFDSSGLNGAYPGRLFQANDGYLYINTASGGAYCGINGEIDCLGTLSRISTTGVLQLLYTNTLAVGGPFSGVVQDTNGLFYATPTTEVPAVTALTTAATAQS